MSSKALDLAHTQSLERGGGYSREAGTRGALTHLYAGGDLNMRPGRTGPYVVGGAARRLVGPGPVERIAELLFGHNEAVVAGPHSVFKVQRLTFRRRHIIAPGTLQVCTMNAQQRTLNALGCLLVSATALGTCSMHSPSGDLAIDHFLPNLIPQPYLTAHFPPLGTSFQSCLAIQPQRSRFLC